MSAIPTSSDRLPVPLTPLVGREREVADALTLLHDPAMRLLTSPVPAASGRLGWHYGWPGSHHQQVMSNADHFTLYARGDRILSHLRPFLTTVVRTAGEALVVR